MKEFINRLRELKSKKLTESDKKNIVEFGKGFEMAGKYYQTAGEIIEVIGKALQQPENVDRVAKGFEQVKKAVLETVIDITRNNEPLFDHIADCAQEFADEIEAAAQQPEETHEESYEEKRARLKAKFRGEEQCAG